MGPDDIPRAKHCIRVSVGGKVGVTDFPLKNIALDISDKKRILLDMFIYHHILLLSTANHNYN